ncbi:MAG TPA: twin-arginine translocase TatA/TatE family subunit [Candidatus Acidoferrum sp.]|nr:twin-arginine translocase TatA/TatE family subunit [Candidatus Acidoferrum sp.]
MLSIPHMIVVFVVVLVVFGPKKLPELARGLGKLMAEFRKASTDFKSAFEEEMRDMERQALLAERKKTAEAVAASAAVEPVQSAAIAASSETETPANKASAAPPVTETPVITPVAESVARGSEDSAENGTETAATNLQEYPQDARRPA